MTYCLGTSSTYWWMAVHQYSVQHIGHSREPWGIPAYWSQWGSLGNTASMARNELCKDSGWLTHLPLVPHICISELGQHWFRWCLEYGREIIGARPSAGNYSTAMTLEIQVSTNVVMPHSDYAFFFSDNGLSPKRRHIKWFLKWNFICYCYSLKMLYIYIPSSL